MSRSNSARRERVDEVLHERLARRRPRANLSSARPSAFLARGRAAAALGGGGCGAPWRRAHRRDDRGGRGGLGGRSLPARGRAPGRVRAGASGRRRPVRRRFVEAPRQASSPRAASARGADRVVKGRGPQAAQRQRGRSSCALADALQQGFEGILLRRMRVPACFPLFALAAAVAPPPGLPLVWWARPVANYTSVGYDAGTLDVVFSSDCSAGAAAQRMKTVYPDQYTVLTLCDRGYSYVVDPDSRGGGCELWPVEDDTCATCACPFCATRRARGATAGGAVAGARAARPAPRRSRASPCACARRAAQRRRRRARGPRRRRCRARLALGRQRSVAHDQHVARRRQHDAAGRRVDVPDICANLTPPARPARPARSPRPARPPPPTAAPTTAPTTARGRGRAAAISARFATAITTNIRGRPHRATCSRPRRLRAGPRAARAHDVRQLPHGARRLRGRRRTSGTSTAPTAVSRAADGAVAPRCARVRAALRRETRRQLLTRPRRSPRRTARRSRGTRAPPRRTRTRRDDVRGAEGALATGASPGADGAPPVERVRSPGGSAPSSRSRTHDRGRRGGLRAARVFPTTPRALVHCPGRRARLPLQSLALKQAPVFVFLKTPVCTLVLEWRLRSVSGR